MTTWTTAHFRLHSTDHPCVSQHEDAASLHLLGWSREERGFCLTFTRAHLDVARKLLEALEALPPLPSETEPFAA